MEAAVKNHSSVIRFKEKYKTAFGGFGGLLKTELIENMQGLDIHKEETALADAIFARLGAVPLADKYSVYQALDDEWVKTAVDLEIIQTEGFAAVKKVVPNMVLRKKDGKDYEVQDGWAGLVIPFDLVQATLLQADMAELTAKEERLAEIAAAYEEMIDSLPEEDEESDTPSEDEARAAALQKEEKALKAAVRKQTAALHMKTKATIEGLTDAQALDLLEIKWIASLLAAIHRVPDGIFADLVSKVRALADKYAVTYADIAAQIVKTKSSLCALIDGLTGNAFDISRFARNTRDLLDLVERLTAKGVDFISKKECIDTTTPTGKFMLTVFGAVATLERESILSRQAVGMIILPQRLVFCSIQLCLKSIANNK